VSTEEGEDLIDKKMREKEKVSKKRNDASKKK
jgi:hypothetical protein